MRCTRQLCEWAPALILVVLAVPTAARPWGCEGHETIARIADKHLTAHAHRMVNQLLLPSPIDPHLQRFCHGAGQNVLADVSTWADDVRAEATSPYFGTGPWHFIDIPRAAASGSLHRFCPERSGCILSAIADQLGVLRGPGADRRKSAEALMLLVHLVGDLHQPLHCATNADGGGNCVPVSYFGLTPQLPADRVEGAIYQPNLHAVWDTNIIRKILSGRGAAWFAELLEQRFQRQIPAWQRMPIDFDAWALESHRAAERVVYGQLPIAIPVASPGREARCADVSPRMLALHERLGQRYQDNAAPLVEERLAKAGIRLAVVLNHLWP